MLPIIPLVTGFFSTKWKLILGVAIGVILAFTIGFFYGKSSAKNKQLVKDAKEIINRVNEEVKIIDSGNTLQDNIVKIKSKAKSNPTKENLNIKDEYYSCLLSNDPLKKDCNPKG